MIRQSRPRYHYLSDFMQAFKRLRFDKAFCIWGWLNAQDSIPRLTCLLNRPACSPESFDDVQSLMNIILSFSDLSNFDRLHRVTLPRIAFWQAPVRERRR